MKDFWLKKITSLSLMTPEKVDEAPIYEDLNKTKNFIAFNTVLKTFLIFFVYLNELNNVIFF